MMNLIHQVIEVRLQERVLGSRVKILEEFHGTIYLLFISTAVSCAITSHSSGRDCCRCCWHCCWHCGQKLTSKLIARILRLTSPHLTEVNFELDLELELVVQ